MISVSKAKELQQAGIPQSEHLGNAKERAEAAIRDMSRKGHSHVQLCVFFLSKESFDELVVFLGLYGFECTDTQWAERTSKVTIRWSSEPEKDEGA